MEQKKSEKANLQSKKVIFLEIGLVLTLLAIWGVFEFSTKAENAAAYNQLILNIDDDMIEIPVTQQEPPKMPPAPPVQKIAQIIEVVNNDQPTDNDNFNTEIDPNSSVSIQEIPAITCGEEPEDTNEDPNTTRRWFSKRSNGKKGRGIIVKTQNFASLQQTHPIFIFSKNLTRCLRTLQHL